VQVEPGDDVGDRVVAGAGRPAGAGVHVDAVEDLRHPLEAGDAVVGAAEDGTGRG
jgi:hypothetical protein